MAAAGALESGDSELEPRLQLLRGRARESLLTCNPIIIDYVMNVKYSTSIDNVSTVFNIEPRRNHLEYRLAGKRRHLLSI